MNVQWTKVLLIAVGFAAITAGRASAQTFTLTANLTGAGEATQTTNGINTASFGSAVIVVDVGAQTVTYTVTVFNLPSGVTASHIHAGAALTSGPVVINFAPPLTASNDFSFTGTVKASDFVMRPDQGIRSPDDVFQMLAGANGYVNVHSSVNPGGEIRGQLVLK